MQTLQSLVSEYILQNDLRESTADQMHRIAGVYRSWHGGNVPLAEFTPNRVSEFLAAKQAAGRSPYYRKSLRNTLVSLLRFAGKEGKVRPVRLHELDPLSWTPEEVARLIAACDRLRGAQRRSAWKLLIATGYYTGLSHVDLRSLRREDVGPDGVIRLRRSKTGRVAVVALPVELLPTLPDGELFPLETSLEAFRATFRRLVKWAGLRGTFKTLRKTAGTLVDRKHPGMGHILLANSRKVFDAHYRSRDIVPLSPPPLELPDRGPDAA
jgi:integrase